MSESRKFWLSINSILGVVILGVVFLGTSYLKDYNKKIVDMVGQGVDPVAVMCAMQDDYGNMPVCIVLASKKSD